MSQGVSKPYVLDDVDEPGRLERQALLGDLPRFFERFALAPDARVLDAGCGSGVMTRLLARRVPAGSATGVDTNARHIASAAQQAAAEGLTNIDFQEGSIFALPFPDASFDLVWCKYVLQWVEHPGQAVAEFRRVTRSGGLVVCVNFDGFGLTHDPVDPAFQADAEAFFPSVVDPFVGRKQFRMFYDAGLRAIHVFTEADPLYTVVGSMTPRGARTGAPSSPRRSRRSCAAWAQRSARRRSWSASSPTTTGRIPRRTAPSTRSRAVRPMWAANERWPGVHHSRGHWRSP